ncbi:MAG: YciI family protein [Paenibacillus macerans]|uniref:YCII-related domain protein n=1 Tax=Paenibacillus macerans TaxID=44252 RepID=A0A090Z621_PAEMA|nr:YciI family protein [Paenibacillus macerans]KFN05615.1 YCII-related domain protein [Paenibacillus macerans]MCY7559819.1 YciI family protein [Paenibacillus macerans]MDU7476318.1 YciI family protein [Paenibacillus macerans]MEC0137564.1 YciI family protein [Paenibacillus macerans]MEC0151541.1 YciI family protein [Paenibacillus macerans]
MFVIILTYTKPLETVDSLLPEHAAYLERQYEKGVFIVSGRRVPRDGGVILANAGSREEIEAIIEGDPFYKEKVAVYEVLEFMPTRFDSRFGAFVGPTNS